MIDCTPQWFWKKLSLDSIRYIIRSWISPKKKHVGIAGYLEILSVEITWLGVLLHPMDPRSAFQHFSGVMTLGVTANLWQPGHVEHQKSMGHSNVKTWIIPQRVPWINLGSSKCECRRFLIFLPVSLLNTTSLRLLLDFFRGNTNRINLGNPQQRSLCKHTPAIFP